MNFILGAIGANFTLTLVSGISSAANGVYDLASKVVNSASTGSAEVKIIIKETDLEVKIKTIQLMMCELKITKDTPYTVLYVIESIRDAIKDIEDELDLIYYRMQYNDNLWIGSTVRAYKFHKCGERLHAKLKNLESRRSTLVELMSIEAKMNKNKLLENDVSDSILQIDDIDPKIAERIRLELHKKLEFINK